MAERIEHRLLVELGGIRVHDDCRVNKIVCSIWAAAHIQDRIPVDPT